jgi:hypothetical protein
LDACVPSSDCNAAIQALDDCGSQNCAAQCLPPTADGGVPSGSGPLDPSTTGRCFPDPGQTCPTANLIGCCTFGGSQTCFYMPMYTADVMQQCTVGKGTWSTSM